MVEEYDNSKLMQESKYYQLLRDEFIAQGIEQLYLAAAQTQSLETFKQNA